MGLHIPNTFDVMEPVYPIINEQNIGQTKFILCLMAKLVKSTIWARIAP